MLTGHVLQCLPQLFGELDVGANGGTTPQPLLNSELSPSQEHASPEMQRRTSVDGSVGGFAQNEFGEQPFPFPYSASHEQAGYVQEQ